MTLEEAKSKSCSCVYCLGFPNGMKYVGKTKDLCGRMKLYERFDGCSRVMRDAIEMFGWGEIGVTILREVKCDDRVDLDLCLSLLEVKYIRDLGTLVPNGYNVSIGGECLGIPIECITTDSDVVRRYNSGAKAVLLYDLDGNYVKEYESIARMAYDLASNEEIIRPVLNTWKVFHGKYYLRTKRYDYAPQKIEVAPPKVRENIVYKDVIVERERVKYKDVIVRNEIQKFVERKVVKKPHILRYDMNGDFCGEYDNLKDACLSFTASSSGISCGVYRKGYILFKKESDDFPKKIEPYTILSKKVTGDYYRPADELEDRAPNMNVDNDGLPKKKVGRPKKEKSASEDKERLNVDGRYTNINLDYPICQYTLDGDFVRKYDSIRDAAYYTGLTYANIWACVVGRTRKSQGFIWRKEGDDLNVTKKVKCETPKEQKTSIDDLNF